MGLMHHSHNQSITEVPGFLNEMQTGDGDVITYESCTEVVSTFGSL